MHAIKTIRAAESYRGPSIIVAFSHCIAWGIDMSIGMDIQKDAVACGYWPLYSFDPRVEEHPFVLASKKPVGAYKDFALKEGRFNILSRSKPEESAKLLDLGQQDILKRYHLYEQLADVSRLSAAGLAAAVEGGNGDNGGTKQESKEAQV
jgi:pyruvate-ferredoxin/flavodoxin oxidoreductase